MKRLLIPFAALLSVQAFAQNLNPTIVVTNTYESTSAGIQKPAQLLQVPDSVTRFNLDFDYSVYSTPYRGAYEFHPYLVSMKPLPDPSDASQLYARVGAGFTLRPEAELVWNQALGHGFKLLLHGDMDSYFGPYSRISPVLDERDRVFEPVENTPDNTADGMRLRAGLGADLTYDAEWGQAGLGLSWLNRTNRSPLQAPDLPAAGYDQLAVRTFVRSYNLSDPGWVWRGDLSYRYGRDRLPSAMPCEHGISLSGGLDRVLEKAGRFGLDAGLDLVRVGEGALSTGGLIRLRPHYVFTLERFEADLGVRVDAHLRDNPVESGASFYDTKSQLLYPAVHLRYPVVEDKLTVYADVTGGSSMNTYASVLEYHSFCRWNDWARTRLPLDFSLERIRAAGGIRGQIASRMQLDLSGGYAVQGHVLCDALPYNDDEAPALAYSNCYVGFANLAYWWNSQDVTVEGNFLYQHSVLSEDRVFAPAPFSGTFRAGYTWNKRLLAALTAEFASARTGVYDDYSTLRIPGYFDLGLQADFRTSGLLGVWMRAGNLLGQTIQRHPLFAERGPYVTVGVTLNIR